MTTSPAIEAPEVARWAQLAALTPALGVEFTQQLLTLLADAVPTDGRAARSYHTRRAIVEALRELHDQGDIRPTAAQVAEQAGVSLRTVWQHFADLEGLMIESSRRDIEILFDQMRPIRIDSPLATRISEFAAQRTRILERMSPSWRAARHYDPFSAPLQRCKLLTNALGRAEVETVFAPELVQSTRARRAGLVDALTGVTLWAHWESLRTDVGLDVRRARRAVEFDMSALLAASGFDSGTARLSAR